MTEEQVLSRLGEARCSTAKAVRRCVARPAGAIRIAGAPIIAIEVHLANNQVELIFAGFPRSAFDRVLDAAQERYGEQTDKSPDWEPLRGGFGELRVTWIRTDGALMLSRPDMSDPLATALLSSEAANDRYSTRRDERRRDDAKAF
jgi:hypothetical protein